MRFFRWFSAGAIPAAYDLRRLGWQLLTDEQRSGWNVAHAVLGRPHDLPMAKWMGLAGCSPIERRWMMMLEVGETIERARMLRLGFGDALCHGPGLDELEVRVMRLIQQAESLPRYRQLGPVRLDLLQRDAVVAGKSLGLHPREFALIWRLAETPDEPVGPSDLLRDVWRLSFRPETNSLAVHVSRLRTKLRHAGVDGLIETDPDGSYCLALRGRTPANPYPGNFALDRSARLGKEHAHI